MTAGCAEGALVVCQILEECLLPVVKRSAYGISDEEVVNLTAHQLLLPIEFPLWKMAFTLRSSKVKDELKQLLTIFMPPICEKFFIVNGILA